MIILETKSYEEMSKKASEILINEIEKKPDIILGLASGSTTLGLYGLLARKKKINFSKVSSFNLDEYYPIRRKDRNSFYYFMHKNLINKININESNVHILNGEAKDPKKECKNYEKMIKKKPIDVQILGLGINGHIAFNEPGSKFNSRTRLVELDKETINANSRFFKNRPAPKSALTMGIFNIMNARKIILLASGKNKAEAIKHLIEGKEDENWPVSFLRRHKNLVIIIDKEAASLLHQENLECASP